MYPRDYLPHRDYLYTLRAARELISDRNRWTTGFYARDVQGYPVDVDSPKACQFCAIGALYKSWNYFPGIDGLLCFMQKHTQGKGISEINDHHGHAATLALFDRVIAFIEKNVNANT